LSRWGAWFSGSWRTPAEIKAADSSYSSSSSSTAEKKKKRRGVHAWSAAVRWLGAPNAANFMQGDWIDNASGELVWWLGDPPHVSRARAAAHAKDLQTTLPDSKLAAASSKTTMILSNRSGSFGDFLHAKKPFGFAAACAAGIMPRSFLVYAYLFDADIFRFLTTPLWTTSASTAAKAGGSASNLWTTSAPTASKAAGSASTSDEVPLGRFVVAGFLVPHLVIALSVLRWWSLHPFGVMLCCARSFAATIAEFRAVAMVFFAFVGGADQVVGGFRRNPPNRLRNHPPQQQAQPAPPVAQQARPAEGAAARAGADADARRRGPTMVAVARALAPLLWRSAILEPTVLFAAAVLCGLLLPPGMADIALLLVLTAPSPLAIRGAPLLLAEAAVLAEAIRFQARRGRDAWRPQVRVGRAAQAQERDRDRRHERDRAGRRPTHWPPPLALSPAVDIGGVSVAGDGEQDAGAAYEEFICPITRSIMREPAVTPSGISYDRPNLARWVRERGTDPGTGQPLREKHLYPNLALRSTIERWAKGKGLLMEAVTPVDDEAVSPPAEGDAADAGEGDAGGAGAGVGAGGAAVAGAGAGAAAAAAPAPRRPMARRSGGSGGVVAGGADSTRAFGGGIMGGGTAAAAAAETTGGGAGAGAGGSGQASPSPPPRPRRRGG